MKQYVSAWRFFKVRQKIHTINVCPVSEIQFEMNEHFKGTIRGEDPLIFMIFENLWMKV